MVAYEFLTEVTVNRTLPIPVSTAPLLAAGKQVRVILLVEEDEYQNGHPVHENLPHSSLWQIVTAIKRMPKAPTPIQPESGLLGHHLAELERDIDPDFDITAWLQAWDQSEADLKRESLEREERLLQEIGNDPLFA